MHRAVPIGAIAAAAMATSGLAWGQDTTATTTTTPAPASTAPSATATIIGALPSFTGQTTLGTAAGEMEGWMLSASAIDAAARQIADCVRVPEKADATTCPRKGQAANPKIILLADADKLNFAMAESIRTELFSLNRALEQTVDRACQAATSTGGSRTSTGPRVLGFAPLVALLPLAGSLIGAAKSETTISGFAVTTDDRLLVNAVAGQGGADWVVPGEGVDPGDLTTSSLYAPWARTLAARKALTDCRNTLPADDSGKARAATVDAAIAREDEFATRVAQTTAVGPSLLVQAAQLELMRGGDPLVLRLKIEHAGGSLIKTSNIKTMFGATGVRLTGGLVVSYRLSRPTTGQVLQAGVLVCRTALTGLKAVQNGTVEPGSCAATIKPIA